ncbi:hypothetical protein [Autumnicola psychrophila]|uniref:Uncharacterized protein n=1 Tax=Autumnicola psychrophila TaxID=3075592 RepID=A0ABU3DTK6_9FLAO|nr:hypothetical protein [Zunongwangia sp. F225]MDT0687041.1 hypothetical protein [Zunongwangia sp. F225]
MLLDCFVLGRKEKQVSTGSPGSNEAVFFSVLYDKTQEVPQAYKAACTPEFSLFNDEIKLIYRGRLNNSSTGNGILEKDGIFGKPWMLC